MFKRALARPVAAALTVLITALPAIAATEADINARIKSLLGDPARYETVIKAFQQAVAADSRQDVAAFVRYPIRVRINGGTATVNSASAFVQNYTRIMTAGIIDAIKTQKYEDLFVNGQGVMFGNGQAWLNGICLDSKCKQFVVKVITLQDAPAS